MSAGLLDIAVSGLSAYQQALNTTSNNISNATTAGYSVEKAQFGTQPELYTAGGFVGQGVTVNTISRQYNEFLNNQVLSSNSAYQSSNTYYTMAAQIDNMIADKNAGLSSAMTSFFNSVSNVANAPTSLPTRQVMLTDANNLTNQFNSIAGTFSDLNNQVNGNLTNSVTQLKNAASSIALLNSQIVAASNNGNQLTPNTLMDQRDQLLNQISQLTNISLVNQNDGSVNVYFGQGQPLVLGSTSNNLTVQSSPTDSSQLQIISNGQNVSNQIVGGSIAGYLQFQSQVLVPAQQQLGLIATGLATEVNNMQANGTDLTGSAGQAMFSLGAPTVKVQGQYADSHLQVLATFSPPTAANISSLGGNYQLTVNSTNPDAFTLKNLTNNTSIANLTNATLPAATQAAGFNINFSNGHLTAGDSFQISSTANASTSIQMLLTNPNQIAAAGSSALGTANSSDNSNALSMANLQTQALLQNGTSSFSQVYAQLVSSVGANTNTAQTNSTAQNTVLQNATTAQQNVSGVNLNEEAANLIIYQNAYQAAAKTVNTAQTLFSALLSAIG